MNRSFRLINALIIVITGEIAKINNIAAMIVFLCYGVFWAVVGIIFLNNKGTGIFSILYPRHKYPIEKFYDKKALFHFEGWVNIVLSFGFLAVSIGAYFENAVICIIGGGYLIAICIACVIYAKKSKRFRI